MSVHQTVENVYLRQDAVQLTRRHLWRLLGMLLVVTVTGVALDFALTSIGDIITAPEVIAATTALQNYAGSQNLTSTAPVMEALLGLFASPKFWLFNLAYIVLTALVSQGLSLGQKEQLLLAGRGGVPKVPGVFAGMRHCLKAWGLALLIGLKTLLWMLPGVLTAIIGSALALGSYSDVGAPLNVAGMVLMIVLVIPAVFRYALAPFILADEPHRGVRECILMSKVLMKGRKLQYFKLGVPMALKMLGVFYAAAIVGTFILATTGLTQSPAAIISLVLVIALPCIYFSLQMDMVRALFYLKRRAPEEPSPEESVPAEATSDIPAEPAEELPENIIPETNEEKENPDEQPVC